jgi:hypothetical protein
MAGLINLPGYAVPNALNFSGLNAGIDSIRDQKQQQVQNALMQEQMGMKREQLGMQRESHGVQMQQARTAQEVAEARRVAGTVQGIMALPEQQRMAAWQQTLTQPGFRDLPPEMRDLQRAAPLLLSKAAEYTDPLDRRAKEATIGMTGAHAEYYRAQAAKARSEATNEGGYNKNATLFTDGVDTWAMQTGAKGKPIYHRVEVPGQQGSAQGALPPPPDTGQARFAQPNAAPPAQPRGPLRVVGTTVAGGTMFDRFGQPIRDLRGTIEDKETAEEVGKSRGLARANFDKIQQGSASTLRYLDDLEKDPGLPSVLGPIDSRTPNWFNQGVESKIDQLGGRAFLEAFAAIKGGGAITEPEGAKATIALSRLSNKGLSVPEYKQAIADFRREVIELTELARRKAAGGGGSYGSAPGGSSAAPDAAPKRLRYNPATGELE